MPGYLELLDGEPFCRHSETDMPVVPRGAPGICPQALLASAQDHHANGRRGNALAAVKLLGYLSGATPPPGFIDLRAEVYTSLGKPCPINP